MTEKELEAKILALETKVQKLEKLVGGIMRQMTMAALQVEG